MPLPNGDGRAARTALLAVFSATMGANHFDGASDLWAAILPFVVMTLLTGALIIELTDQARRHAPTGATRWAGTDTAIVSVLVGLAALLSAAAAFRPIPPSEQTAAACFAALYLVLAACFTWVRRNTVSNSRTNAAAGLAAKDN